jgi:ribosomal protein L3 glutamine methyltransferase
LLRRNQQRIAWLCRRDRRLIDGLRAAVSIFESEGLRFGQGTADAHEDAAWLMLWCLDLPRDRLDDYLDSLIPASEWRVLSRLIRKRVEQRMPVSYLTGEAWLGGLRFRSDQRGLIPRSLLAEALSFCLNEGMIDQPATILDLCTGSGSILIHAGHHFPNAALFGSDLSPEALDLAKLNLEDHGMAGRATLKQGSGLEPWAKQQFDLMLCNPPYVNKGSMQTLPAEFRAEPAAALDGGEDGMDFCRPFLRQAQARLRGHGQILLEIGHEAAHFEAAFPDLEKTWVPVQAGGCMVVLITRKALMRLA